MSTYFAFSDECGAYKQNLSRYFLKIPPYYLRATYVIKATEWKTLRQEVAAQKDDFELSKKEEIKCSYICSLRSSQIIGHDINEERDWYFLRNHHWEDLLNYVENILSILKKELDYCIALVTLTPNDGPQLRPRNLHRMHIQDKIQRLQYDIQECEGELCVPFFDSVNNPKMIL